MAQRCSYISTEGQSLIVIAKERGGTTEGDIRAISDRHQCKADAAWGVYRVGADPRRPAFTCADHVGRFLGTGEYRVVPIAACPKLSIVKTAAPRALTGDVTGKPVGLFPADSNVMTITTVDQRHHLDLIASVIMPRTVDVAIRARPTPAQFAALNDIRASRSPVIIAVRGAKPLARNAVMTNMEARTSVEIDAFVLEMEFQEIRTAIAIAPAPADRAKIKISGGTGAGAIKPSDWNESHAITSAPTPATKPLSLMTEFRFTKEQLKDVQDNIERALLEYHSTVGKINITP